ncbi:MAG: MBL fold metallo-hydrolase [Pseudobdellovibrionaceae bacterium]
MLLFQQLFEPESSTYTYILGDSDSKEAVIIDSVLETAERDWKIVNEMGLKLKYILETHIHADHITGADILKTRSTAKTGVNKAAQVQCADMEIQDGDVIRFGPYQLRAIATPGHTDGCMSYFGEGRVFTGDALLIRGCGRTDFQQGSSTRLYQSVTQKLFALPEDTIVYPAHDYKGITSSMIGIEKKFNPRLGAGKTETEFSKIMAELGLADPKKIQIAVPANMRCGQMEK